MSVAVALVSFEVSAQKNYASLSGKITNKSSDSLIVRSRTFSKKIVVKNDGSFADTLKVEKGYYNLFDGQESTTIYLQNGYDLKLSLDTKAFDETLKYSGNGAAENNYLAKNALLIEEIQSNESLFNLNKVDFDKEIASNTVKLNTLLKNSKGLEESFSATEAKKTVGFMKYLSGTYEEKVYLNTVLGKGKASPKFVNFENNAGGTTSLDDLKGKYVYIDVWATWCGPCKVEIPFLKTVEKDYHNKNIAFISLSADKAKDHGKWKTMIQEKELSGIQLFSDADFETSFMRDYKINAIPRFILIDPNGNIVSADAPRPSDKKLIDLFNELGI